MLVKNRNCIYCKYAYGFFCSTELPYYYEWDISLAFKDGLTWPECFRIIKQIQNVRDNRENIYLTFKLSLNTNEWLIKPLIGSKLITIVPSIHDNQKVYNCGSEVVMPYLFESINWELVAIHTRYATCMEYLFSNLIVNFQPFWRDQLWNDMDYDLNIIVESLLKYQSPMSFYILDLVYNKSIKSCQVLFKCLDEKRYQYHVDKCVKYFIEDIFQYDSVFS